jgi:predicted transcriptional regulator
VDRRDAGQRRPPGALEAEIMGILWAAGRPLNPTEVQTELGDDLAYNTVLTILTRLLEKGLLAREPSGRGHAYQPVHDAATTAASQMRATLTHQTDRQSVLLKFASGLAPDEVEVLRAFLAESGAAGEAGPDGTGAAGPGTGAGATMPAGLPAPTTVEAYPPAEVEPAGAAWPAGTAPATRSGDLPPG